ncbi:MAG: retropepsin-like domain-containing protein [Phycisphaeraceae bacterium]|nr:retropepsin-like domain-containing protein [Phycisphaeraceae bacterium]
MTKTPLASALVIGHWSLVICLFSFALLLFSCAAQPYAPQSQQNLHNIRPTTAPLMPVGGFQLLDVHVNGRDGGRFMLDTGSNLCLIDRGAAARLELPVTGQGQALGVAGAESFDYCTIDNLSIEGFSLPPRTLGAVNLFAMRRSGAPMAGILGFNALAQECFTIDPRKRTLTIGDSWDDSIHSEPLLLINRLPAVRVKLGRREAVLILDTGADNELTLHAEAVRGWPDIFSVPQTGSGMSRGMGGVVAGSRTWVKQITVLGVSIQDVAVSVDPTPPGLNRHTPVAGRVGNAVLRNFLLTFDAPHNRIGAKWLPIIEDNKSQSQPAGGR